MKNKIQPLELPPLPQSIMGRLRKDGKPDRRYKHGLYMLQEHLEEASGVPSAAMGGCPVNKTATEIVMTMTLNLHCRKCDHYWSCQWEEMSQNTRCPECGSTKVYGDDHPVPKPKRGRPKKVQESE